MKGGERQGAAVKLVVGLVRMDFWAEVDRRGLGESRASLYGAKAEATFSILLDTWHA